MFNIDILSTKSKNNFEVSAGKISITESQNGRGWKGPLWVI